MNNVLEPLAYTIDESREAARVGRTTIYQEIAAGRLIARKVGRRTIILRDDLKSWLARLAQAKTTA
ncbi:MAG: helix-turn-helix domain-containing protein [Proteobacteria bacterium]|nr:helix-turn-helix domain-containing protein [Pseudomonadota bacterium]